MSEDALERVERNKAYQASWRAANPEKVREQQARYRAANPEKVKERRERYRAANPEKVKEHRASYRAANPEKVKASGERYQVANPEKMREKQASWIASNPELAKAIWISKNSKRRARKAKNGTYLVSKKEILKLISSPCIYCGSLDFITIEHVIPISRGGTHGIGNLASACKSCNFSKSAKFITEWRKHMRGYRGEQA
jgi:5-methylcytosine-specific restriction endonuclease McrA